MTNNYSKFIKIGVFCCATIAFNSANAGFFTSYALGIPTTFSVGSLAGASLSKSDKPTQKQAIKENLATTEVKAETSKPSVQIPAATTVAQSDVEVKPVIVTQTSETKQEAIKLVESATSMKAKEEDNTTTETVGILLGASAVGAGVLYATSIKRRRQDSQLSPRDKAIVKTLRKLGVNIDNVSINNDGTVDVNGDVIINRQNLVKLPVQFGTINGDFDCGINFLTNLEGAPYFVKGYFSCADNNLTTLKGSPKVVGGNYHCQRNQLTNLEHIADEIGENLYAGNNKIDTLAFFPNKINGDVEISWNKVDNVETLQKFDFKKLTMTNQYEDYVFYKGASLKPLMQNEKSTTRKLKP